jgi:hypothetical protein
MSYGDPGHIEKIVEPVKLIVDEGFKRSYIENRY